METIINYSGLAIGILLALISLFLQIRGNKKKEPVYSITSNNLISDYTSKYQSLRVSYDRKKVENLTFSKVLFYNRGAETITQEDIATKNRPRIVPKEGVKILDSSILQMNNPSNNVGIPDYENQVIIWFDYLDKNQGVVYQIIHTGTSSNDIEIVGDIRGVSKIKKLAPFRRSHSRAWSFFTSLGRSKRFVQASMLIVALVMVGALYSLFLDRSKPTPFIIDVMVLLGVAIYIGFLFYSYRLVFDFPAPPKGLESFDEH